MKEVIELNKSMLAEVAGCLSDGVLIVDRDNGPKVREALPAKWQAEIEALRAKVNEVVPDDFTWTLYLGDDSPDFGLEFNDGPQTGFSGGHDWERDRSLVEQLKGLDWGAERQEAMLASQMLDDIRTKAEHSPSKLPSTHEIQKAFREEMKDFVKTRRKEATKVHVLLFRDDEGLKDETYDDMASFCRELPDIMTVHYLVITVVADGKPLPVERIESLKQLALKELEDMPISHAKALWKL